MNAENYLCFEFKTPSRTVIKHLWINTFEVSRGRLYVFLPCNTETLWVSDGDHLEYLVCGPEPDSWTLLTCQGYSYPVTVLTMPPAVAIALNQLHPMEV